MPAAATRPTAGPRTHAPREARRAQILEAALACFGERGYHATTMDDLVRACGLSKGSLYWHFGGKEDVFLALCDDFTEAIFRGWDEAGDGPVLEVVIRQLERSAALLSSHRPLLLSWAEFISHPVGRDRFAEVYQRSRERLGQLLRAGVAHGEVRDAPIESLAAIVVAAGEGLYLQSMIDPEFDASAHLPALFDVLRAGLAP